VGQVNSYWLLVIGAAADPSAREKGLAATISGQDAHMDALPRQLIELWTDARFSFSALLQSARASLPSAGVLR